MSKVVTVRLSDEDYEKVLASALSEHRPISNFITHKVMNGIEESYYVDKIEMSQILADKKLMKKLDRGHKDAKKMRGKLIG